MITTTAGIILHAIEAGRLEVKALTNEKQTSLVLVISGREVLRVGCLHLDRPGAKVTSDGRSVEVFPSRGLPEGFSIPCDKHEEAVLIAETIDGLFEDAYNNLMDVRAAGE